LLADINLAARGSELASIPVPDPPGKQRRHRNSERKLWSVEAAMINLVKRFLQDQSGATAVEYGLVAAGISVAIIAVVQGLGSKLSAAFVMGTFK
jgi:pilus assembly protein Flp/PilA